MKITNKSQLKQLIKEELNEILIQESIIDKILSKIDNAIVKFIEMHTEGPITEKDRLMIRKNLQTIASRLPREGLVKESWLSDLIMKIVDDKTIETMIYSLLLKYAPDTLSKPQARNATRLMLKKLEKKGVISGVRVY